MHPGLHYKDIMYMKWHKLKTCCKTWLGYNYLQLAVENYFIGFILFLAHHYYIHWKVSTDTFGNRLHSVLLFLYGQYHQH